MDAEDKLANLTEQQLEAIHQRVRDSLESLDHGEYALYEGREGLRKLASEVKARGRTALGSWC